jgi:D-2-hydroxyacid dehydrogenase (NADP+)
MFGRLGPVQKNDLLPQAKKPKYLQSVSAGTNQYDLDGFRAHGIHLASDQGVNTNAVSEHAPGVMLLLIRGLALARDNSQTHLWRREQTNPALREDELAGKTMLILDISGIRDRIASLAKALDTKGSVCAAIPPAAGARQMRCTTYQR